jgi:hypothetical protein
MGSDDPWNRKNNGLLIHVHECVILILFSLQLYLSEKFSGDLSVFYEYIVKLTADSLNRSSPGQTAGDVLYSLDV